MGLRRGKALGIYTRCCRSPSYDDLLATVTFPEVVTGRERFIADSKYPKSPIDYFHGPGRERVREGYPRYFIEGDSYSLLSWRIFLEPSCIDRRGAFTAYWSLRRHVLSMLQSKQKIDYCCRLLYHSAVASCFISKLVSRLEYTEVANIANCTFLIRQLGYVSLENSLQSPRNARILYMIYLDVN